MTHDKLIKKAEAAQTTAELNQIFDEYQMHKYHLGIGEQIQVVGAIYKRRVEITQSGVAQDMRKLMQIMEGR